MHLSICNPLSSTNRGLSNESFKNSGELVGRIVNFGRNYPAYMQNHNSVAFATFLLGNAIIFALSYQCAAYFSNHDKSGPEAGGSERLIWRHIVPNAIVGISALGVSLFIEKVTGYSLPKMILAAITASAVAIRLLMAYYFAIPKEKRLARLELNTSSHIQTEEQVASQPKNEPKAPENKEAATESKQEAATQSKEEVEFKTKEESGTQSKEEAATQSKEEAEARAKEESGTQSKEEAATQSKEVTEAKAKEEAEARAKAEAEAKAKEEAERAKSTTIPKTEAVSSDITKPVDANEIEIQARNKRIEEAKKLAVPKFEVSIISNIKSVKFYVECPQGNKELQELLEILRFGYDVEKMCVIEKIGNKSVFTGATSLIIKLKDANDKEALDKVKSLFKKLKGDDPQEIIEKKEDLIVTKLNNMEKMKESTIRKVRVPKFEYFQLKSNTSEDPSRVLIRCKNDNALLTLYDKMVYSTDISQYAVFDCVDDQSVYTGATQFIIKITDSNKSIDKLLLVLKGSKLKGTAGDGSTVPAYPLSNSQESHYLDIYGKKHDMRIAAMKKEVGIL